jgi:hypothetical protein
VYPRIVICILTGLLLRAEAYSQSFSSHPIALTPTAFPKYQADEDQYLKKLQERLKGLAGEEIINEYAKNSLEEQKHFFNSNEVYDNWPEATDFVKKVFSKSVPAGYGTENIKIFVIRSPDFNAYCMEDGNILVTTGFLAFMNSEAELAATLSHEYGHFYSNHNFLGFAEKKKAEKRRNNALFVTSSTGFGKYYEHLRNAERTADTFAFHFVKKNGYAAEAITENFENLQKLNKKYESLRGYRSTPAYLTTHPSNEERIKEARSFQVKSKLNGKRFLVDSVAFTQIRKRAMDECIYLLFEELRFDECLEMAFLQHLRYPADEFYLYFIIECLRGNMAAVRYYEHYPFITAYYNPGKLNQKKFNPWCFNIRSGQYIKSSDFKISVFNNIESVIFGLDREQLSGISTKHLMKNDTIPFFTNKEALDWFSKKIPDESAVFNHLRLKSGQKITRDCSAEKNQSELEKDLCEIGHNFKKFNSYWDSLDKGMVILHKIQQYDYNGSKLIYFYDLDFQKKFFESYHKFSKSEKYMDIVDEDILNFRERSKIKHIANFVQNINEESFIGKMVDIDFLETCPEFVLQAAQNKLETIYIVNLYLYSVDHSIAYIWGIDIRNKHVSVTKLPLQCSYQAVPRHILSKVFHECETLIKN